HRAWVRVPQIWDNYGFHAAEPQPPREPPTKLGLSRAGHPAVPRLPIAQPVRAGLERSTSTPRCFPAGSSRPQAPGSRVGLFTKPPPRPAEPESTPLRSAATAESIRCGGNLVPKSVPNSADLTRSETKKPDRIRCKPG